MPTRLLKPIDLTPTESASGQQLAHPDRDDLIGVALLSLVKSNEYNTTAGRKG